MEKDTVHRSLGKLIYQQILPGKKAITDCLESEPALQSRSWTDVKNFCRNQITSNAGRQ